METRHYWEENGHAVKYKTFNTNDVFSRGGSSAEQLNFTAPSEDEAEYQSGVGYLKKGKQDPMSHRIIEKRRRDRMNNCLADLSRLIPPEYLKKGRGRVEKTEIIEMAIRHLKYLHERANAADRQIAGEPAEHYRAGFQDAIAETLRYLVEVHGYGPGDGLCVQLASHLQRHCDHVIKGGEQVTRESKLRMAGSSSETGSSSSSSHGYAAKNAAMARAEPPAEPPRYPETFDPPAQDSGFSMDCDRVSVSTMSLNTDETEAPSATTLPLDVRRKRETNLRTVRKPEHTEDYLHSYKFKNSIERRFSRSQDSEAHDLSVRGPAHGKAYSHKRRRAAKPAPSTSTSNSGSTEDARDTSPQDTSSDSPHNHYDKPVPPPTQFVPVFALNSIGKYYVPLNVEYACLARHLGPYDVLDSRVTHLATPLHPVTIDVNFQPCLNYHMKREPNDREWRAE